MPASCNMLDVSILKCLRQAGSSSLPLTYNLKSDNKTKQIRKTLWKHCKDTFDVPIAADVKYFGLYTDTFTSEATSFGLSSNVTSSGINLTGR